MEHNRRQSKISFLILLFFGFCVFQIYGLREDYPFSYFGMYKYGVPQGPYSDFYIDVYLDNKKVENKKIFDPYELKDQLRARLMGELIDKNQNLLRDAESLVISELSAEQKVWVDNIVTEKIIESRFVNKSNKKHKKIQINITYKEWESLSYETSKVPDKLIEIFDNTTLMRYKE